MTEISDSLFKQKLSLGVDLQKRTSQFTKNLYEEIKKSTNKNLNQSVVIKSFLLAATVLNSQISEAVLRKELGIAMIGLRTLLGNNIDLDYIFDHPKHQLDQNWIDKHCIDLFDRTNQLNKLKSGLGDTSIKQRFEDLGRINLYNKNYAGLSDYAHLTLRQNLLALPEHLEKFSIDIISHSLCALFGIQRTVCSFYSLNLDLSLEREIINYRDSFASKDESVTTS